MGSLLKELTFLSQNGYFFQIIESALEVQRVKEQFSDNPGHNILELFNNLIQIRVATSKVKLDIQYNKLGTQFVSQDAERLKIEFLRNQKIFEKCQIQVEGDITQSRNCRISIQNSFSLIINCSKALFNSKLVRDIYFYAKCSRQHVKIWLGGCQLKFHGSICIQMIFTSTSLHCAIRWLPILRLSLLCFGLYRYLK